MEWIRRFIGLPYEDRGRDYTGADCWGVAYLVHRDVFGCADFPRLSDDYRSINDTAGVHEAFVANAERFERIDTPDRAEGDIVMFRLQGLAVHCGVVVDGNRMIHSLPGHECVIERYTGAKWVRRMEGLFRWPR